MDLVLILKFKRHKDQQGKTKGSKYCRKSAPLLQWMLQKISSPICRGQLLHIHLKRPNQGRRTAPHPPTPDLLTTTTFLQPNSGLA